MKVRWRHLLSILLLTACLDPTSPAIVSLQIDSPQSVYFAVVGDTTSLDAHLVNEFGDRQTPMTLRFLSRDARVATVNDLGLIRVVGTGLTYVIAMADAGTTDSVLVSSILAFDSLVVMVNPGQVIQSLPYDSLLTISCRFFDPAGIPSLAAATVTSATGTVSGTSCSTLKARHSGFDTLVVRSDGRQVAVPISLAILPEIAPGPSPAITGVPVNSQPWAPTLRRNSAGEWELYFTAYFYAPEASNGLRGDLYRLRSADGSDFAFDSVALSKDPQVTDPHGTGIENISIVPRAGQGGWRMFFAAGGYDSYGWQIYSAVSSNERTWVKESGVRVSNGGNYIPDPPSTPPWPSGEGIVIDQLPSGEWRMFTGGYENVVPRVDKFQIVEWRSPDQLTWHYLRAVLTTDQVGAGASRSVYSPSIVEVVPGLYRMYFTGDNLNVAGGRSRVYTAVSLDKLTWQTEGPLLANPKIDFFYSSVVDGLLGYIRKPTGGPRALGLTHITTR